MAADPPDESARIRETYSRYAREDRRRLWDRSNRGFDRLKRDAEARLLEMLRESVRDGTRVIDIGSGEGALEELAMSNGITAHWTGIDLLEDSVERARATVPDVDWIVGDAAAMPFDTDAFEVAVAVTIFSSLPSHELEHAVASEIARVLRPGGWLIWHDLRVDNPFNPDVHGVSLARIGQLFPGWDLDLRSFTLAPPVARRLGFTTPVLYPLLHAVPPLRSHLIGRLRCPT
jgi:SAM-dependent methyltransferase